MKVTTSIIRYSPKPLSEYTSDICAGPAKDLQLDGPEIWNLAYLSHDYDESLSHPDPMFHTRVRRTCQFNLLTQTVDMTGKQPEALFMNVMRMPAPWVIRWLQDRPETLDALPLFQAYDMRWFRTMMKRSRLCGDYGHAPEPDIQSLTDAMQLILRVKSGL